MAILIMTSETICPSCWSPVEAEARHCSKCFYLGSPERWLGYQPADKLLASGKYRLFEPLGAGGFGFTSRAVQYCGDVGLGSVAIKTLFRSADEGGHADLIREAATLRAASHPNLVSLHDAFSDEDGAHLVMEYVDGVPLDEALFYREVVSLDFVIRVGVQISDALGLLHGKGVVHCDLTPRNIALLRWLQPEPSFVKVLDFGIACRWEKGAGFLGRGAGTPGFSAPEQLLGSPTPRSDVFAVGVLLYWMLTGELPYPPELSYEPRRLLAERVPQLDGRVPPEVADLVKRCIHPLEQKRYPAMPSRDLHRLQAAGLTEVRDPTTSGADPRAILKLAKETFISAGLAASDREKSVLYRRSAEYFDRAAAVGALPTSLAGKAEKARRYANLYAAKRERR